MEMKVRNTPPTLLVSCCEHNLCPSRLQYPLRVIAPLFPCDMPLQVEVVIAHDEVRRRVARSHVCKACKWSCAKKLQQDFLDSQGLPRIVLAWRRRDARVLKACYRLTS